VRGPAGRCPNCSAPIRFRWSSAVQTTCDSCRSVVVRHDVDLETIGEVSDLPPDASPIQLGTTGTLDGRTFTVIGRIVYAWDDGGWNEWHVVFGDGTSGWLSDAQAEYAVTSLVTPTQPVPAISALVPGAPYAWSQHELRVATLTTARYVGVDGELPFEYWGKDAVPFADLRGTDATFATIDYSDDTPRLFVGRAVEFDELSLANLREVHERAAPDTRGFNCPNCGGAVELRALTHTRAVACTTCGALLDPQDRTIVVLQTAEQRETIRPALPLGARGTWHGHPHDVIGFQRRSIEVEGTRYHWDEYVLFNPHRGFRYLSVYEGHWNDIRTVRALPRIRSGHRPSVYHGGRTFRHFQGAVARTDYVLGEFPWRVRVGDLVRTNDYIAPPLLLSSEATDDETTWSLGVYTRGEDIWRAFGVPGAPPRPVGVFANQPSAFGPRLRRTLRAAAALLALLLLVVAWRYATAGRERVFSQGYRYAGPAAQQGEQAFVTPTFRLETPGTVEITINTTLSNAWLGFDLALIDVASGTAYNVVEEVSYYFGKDSDGAWTEGDRQGRVLLPQMPAGEYYLRVEPESDPTTGPVSYSIDVRRDVPSPGPYVLAFFLLLLPPAITGLRLMSFEHRRMQESDYGG